MSASGSLREKTDRRAKGVLWGSIALSVVLHGLASITLSLLPSTSVALAAMNYDRIEFEIEEPEPSTPEHEPEPEAAPEPAAEPEPEAPVVPPREATPPPAREPRPPAETAPEPPAPLAEQEVANLGLTLTADGAGAGWAVHGGTNQDVTGPRGNPVARETGRNVAGRADGEVGGTGTAPAPPAPPRVNQSRPPRAPGGMARLLERSYPTGARARGVEGRARVMFRVLANGQAEPQSIASETPAGEGFGRACIDTVRASSGWTPAVDENGDVVTSRLYPYDCRFRQR